MSYIKTKEVLRLFNDLVNDCTDKDEFYNRAFDAIDTMPTADVVEVVRCKDCKYSVRYECKNDACYKFTMCSRRDSYSEGVDDEDFCSYGERREV